MLIQGAADSKAAATNRPPATAKPRRTAARIDRARIQRSISGVANSAAFDTDSTAPPTWSPSPFWIAKIGT